MARHEVLTPIPGIFYRRPDPDSDPFVAEGDAVQAGATIGLVENEDAVVAGQPVAVVDDGA